MFEKYYFLDLVGHFPPNPPKPIRKRPQSTPRHIPRHSKFNVEVTPTRPTSYPKVTCASRESNRVPPDSRSEGHPTKLFRSQNIASLGILHASKIRGDCPRTRRGFFRSQNCVFVGFPQSKLRFFVKVVLRRDEPPFGTPEQSLLFIVYHIFNDFGTIGSPWLA